MLKMRRVHVNLGNNEECSPLQYAAVKGEPEVVRRLVSRGVKVPTVPTVHPTELTVYIVHI